MKATSVLPGIFLSFSLASCHPETAKKHQTSVGVEVLLCPALKTEDQFINTQAALIKAEDLIQASALKADLSPETIRDSLKITPTQGSKFLTITASHHDKDIAKAIAEAVLESYSDYRKKRESELIEEQLHTLAKAITTQKKEVLATRRELETLTERWGLPTLMKMRPRHS